MEVLRGILRKLDPKLKELKVDEVLDVPNLSTKMVHYLKNFYNQVYTIVGPYYDNKNSNLRKERYILAFIKKGVQNHEN
jgi:hypothetical protein